MFLNIVYILVISTQFIAHSYPIRVEENPAPPKKGLSGLKPTATLHTLAFHQFLDLQSNPYRACLWPVA
jgi:hypothetical protein